MAKVVCIGAGRLASQLIPVLDSQGHTILQVYNRTHDAGEALSRRIRQTHVISSWIELHKQADIYFLLVSDDAIAATAEKLKTWLPPDRIVVHCSGVLGADIIPFKNRGVFYPLQTFSGNHYVHWESTPILISSSDVETQATLSTIAHTISKNVHAIQDEQKPGLHLAAVFANNFSNHMLLLAQKIAAEHHLDFSLLYPLIKETLYKAIDIGPKKSQTGPAIRGDVHTLDKHMTLLAKHPDIQKLYSLISDSIQKENKS